MGERLYERIFKHYTKKQWDKYPAELDASVLMRLPCRTSTDDRYFSDEWQALPVHGYTRIFENMLLKVPTSQSTRRTAISHATHAAQTPYSSHATRSSHPARDIHAARAHLRG